MKHVASPVAPLVVDFVVGTRVHREEARAGGLPVVQNGPPGTFVSFLGGSRVPLPTDQIVFAEDRDGHARVGFGGMRWGGVENDQLVFHRVRDLQPGELLSPERGVRMTLELPMVLAVWSDDALVWRSATALH